MNWETFIHNPQIGQSFSCKHLWSNHFSYMLLVTAWLTFPFAVLHVTLSPPELCWAISEALRYGWRVTLSWTKLGVTLSCLEHCSTWRTTVDLLLLLFSTSVTIWVFLPAREQGDQLSGSKQTSLFENTLKLSTYWGTVDLLSSLTV